MTRAASWLAALLLLSSCKEKPAAPDVPRPVLSMLVVSQTEQILGFSGIIEPRFKVDLGFRVLGRMISRDVDIGSTVRAGAILATIEASALDLAARSAAADVETARAQLTNAVGREGRQAFLRDRGAAPISQLESAQQLQEAANASLQRAQANLAKAREQLSYAQLRSDMDGIVTAVSAEIGQVVAPGQAVITVARPDVREAAIDVPKAVADTLKPGVAFTIALQLDPTIQVGGQVREIAPQADPITRTYRVMVTLTENKDALRLGTIVTATLKTKAVATMDVPNSALLESNGKISVWVVDAAKSQVNPRDVTIAARGPTTSRIATGLAPGDRVVTAGVHSLRAGQTIKLLDRPAS